MFNLEQSIAEWRKQMLAAGIKSPVPLDELENHLREEIEEQIHSGKNEQQAFEATVLNFGQSQELQSEFSKERDWWDLLHGHIPKRPRFVLVIWVAFCLLELISAFEKHAHSPATWLTNALLIFSLAIIAIMAYMTGIFWSLFLVRTTKRMRGIIRVIVNLGNFLILIPIILGFTRPASHFYGWSSILYIPFYFNLFTGVFLDSLVLAESKKTAK